MAIEWFDRNAGSDAMQSKDDGTVLCIGKIDVGDYVGVPENHPDESVAGKRFVVKEVFLSPCLDPKCGYKRCRTLSIEGGNFCAECPYCQQFYWFSYRNNQP